MPNMKAAIFGEPGRIVPDEKPAHRRHVFALGPIGLCAVAGARPMGATRIIGVDTVPERISRRSSLTASRTIASRTRDGVPKVAIVP